MEKKLAVGILLINDRDGSILVVSRKDNPNDFGLPGGKVDEGETMKEAAERELLEETGITAKGLQPVYFREDNDYIVGIFLATFWTGEINTTEAGVVKWGSWKDLFEGQYGSYNYDLFEHYERYIR